MYIGKSYKLSEFLFWTRKSVYKLGISALLPVLLYQVLEIKWLALPWTIVGLLGTATAFIVGFRNSQTYSRTLEAQQVWTNILNSSRAWGLMVRDFLTDSPQTRTLVHRHFAWLTALRFQMRQPRAWESTEKSHNTEYQRYYSIPEQESDLEFELSRHLSSQDLDYVLSKTNRATHILALQGRSLMELQLQDRISVLYALELERSLKDFYVHQGRSEQVKDTPYPRQYAIINTLLVQIFCFLLPFAMLKELDKLNESVSGLMKGHMVWLVIPFSVVISWMYTSLGQVGESTENPFEGSANDVPISQLCEQIEIELRELLDEKDIPLPTQPRNNIIL